METEGVGHGCDPLEVARPVFVPELLLGRLLLLQDTVALGIFTLHTEHICLVFLPKILSQISAIAPLPNSKTK